MASASQLSEALQIDGGPTRKATSSADISRECSGEVAHGLLAWSPARIIRVNDHPAVVEHAVGALTIILTSHLKDVISDS